MRKTWAALVLRHGTFQAWQVGFKMRCWGDPQNALILILFYWGKPTGLGECILANHSFSKSMGFSSRNPGIFTTILGILRIWNCDFQSNTRDFDIKKFQPTSCPGDFRKFDMFATCSPKQTENKFTFQDLAQHFLMKAGEEVSGFCKNETQLIT